MNNEMSNEKIDNELRKLEAQGLTPKVIRVGKSTYEELARKYSPIADILSDGQEAIVQPPFEESITEYNAIPLEYVNDPDSEEYDDFLEIETYEDTKNL